MKIHIRSEEHTFTIPIPTNLIFSKGSLWLVNHMGRKYSDELQDIPPEALDRLFAEFRRIKGRQGHWTLVEVESANGQYIKITL